MAKSKKNDKQGKSKGTLKDKVLNKKKKTKAKKKAAPPSFEINQIVKFAGYTEQPEDPLFEAGADLIIVDVEKREDGQVLTCIAAANKAAFDADPDDVDGEELVPSEVKIVKRGKAVAKVAEPVNVVDVGDMAKLMRKSNDPTSLALELYQSAHESFFYLGGVLSHIFHEGLFVKAFPGDDGWDNYCQENFGFKGRKGRYYVDIYMQFSMLDADIASLKSIGWSKAAEIARYVTADNVKELISKAEDTPIRELRDTLKQEYTTEGMTPSGKVASRGSKIKKMTFSYSVFEDQGEGISLVMDKAQKELGHDNPNMTFEHIIMEWAAEHLGEASVKKAKSATRKKQRELKAQGVDLQEAA